MKNRAFWYGGGLLALVILTLVSLYVAPYFIRLHAYTILSSSMEPALHRGDIVITRTLLPDKYRVHDVITFFVPGRGNETVTHRIIVIQPAHDRTPEELFTKGDANSNGDSWILSPGNIQGKVILHIPLLGYILYASHTLLGYSFIVLLTFFWLVVPFVRDWCRLGQGGVIQ